ncbi:MAG: hypothetical protein WCD79_05920 [Chthoniobacteraceae bacterium]
MPRTLILPLAGATLFICACLHGSSEELVSRAAAKGDAKIFEGPAAPFAPDIFGAKEKKEGMLRVLTVDERVGYARKDEMVRVPVFFHGGECAGPDALQIVPVEGGAPIPYQADDIRRDASGGVARMHLYFFVSDLPAWGRRQFNLLAVRNSGGSAAVVSVRETDGKVTLAGDDIKVTFHTTGALEGAIEGIETTVGKVSLPEGNLAPAVSVFRQDAKLAQVRANSIDFANAPDAVLVKEMRWAGGSVFAKLVLKLAPKAAPDDIAEYVYMIPRHGNEIIQTELFYPEQDTPDTVGAALNAALTGKLYLGDASTPADQQIVTIPAGLRKEVRSVFSAVNKAVVNARSGISLLAIPYSQPGGDVGQEPDGRVFFCGPESFRTNAGSNSAALRVFWGQLRYIFSNATKQEELWNLSCKNSQPLTAVVDEPWATPDDLFNFAREVGREYWDIKYWGRGFEANLVMNYLTDKPYEKMLEGGSEKPDLRSVIPTQEAVTETFNKKGGQGVPPLDPYTITYSTSAIVPFSAWLEPSKKLDNMAYLLGKAVLLTNDHATPEGWPNIRNFANTFNMKIGPYLCAMWGGMKNGDHDLVQRARDAVTAQNYMADYGHAQRPYNMSAGQGGNTDVLYISVTDYFLRVIELICNEDLGIHPAVYGRYFDMVDVNADIYQRRFAQDKETKEFSKTSDPSWWRATFLRGQGHDHRWESYGCDPYLGVLGKASDHGRVGITEACYYMQREIGKPQSWQGLMDNVFFPAVMTSKALENYQPAVRPALPANVQVSQTGGKNVVTWTAVPDVVGYRIYRAKQMGGPWTWVNSPYATMTPFKLPTEAEMQGWQAQADVDNAAKAQSLGVEVMKLKKEEKIPAWTKMPEPVVAAIPDTLVKGTTFTDEDGAADSVYFITAQDKEGRESRWFPNEPVPSPGKK